MTDNNVSTLSTIFFIGIGGIGMSAIARYFLYHGHRVGGYDRIRTPITMKLEELGASIIYDNDASLIPEDFRAPREIRVVYTPAIQEDNQIRQYYTQNGYEQLKRAKVLGQITANRNALCVAGTHGKTTTSTLLAHLLHESHVGVNAFLGGLSLNYDSNLLLDKKSPYVVVEADEYDRSFHQLLPTSSIITSTQPDHLDIYGTAEEFREAFEHFISLTRAGGVVLVHEDATLDTSVLPSDLQLFTYGERPQSDYYFSNLTYEGGELYFDWHTPTRVLHHLHIGTPIEVNVLNATAALALAESVGLTEDELRRGLSSFKGAHRRFERVLSDAEHPILLDDYAHHPDEIRASLASIHRLYPDLPITVVFQPHLYSRTRDFMADFGSALSLSRDVILLPIYPAREEPIPGITSDALLPYITSEHKCVTTKTDLIQELRQHPAGVVVMMGAGDIEFEVSRVAKYLRTVPRPTRDH